MKRSRNLALRYTLVCRLWAAMISGGNRCFEIRGDQCVTGADIRVDGGLMWGA